MIARSASIVLATLLITASSYGQGGTAMSSPSSDYAPLVGVWRAQMENLPAVTLTITDEGGSLSGAVLFYLLKRSSANDPYTATPGTPEPLLNLKFDGKTLAFQVSHSRAHPPRTVSDPPVPFHMTVIGPDKADLVNENGGPGGLSPMVRTDY